MSTAEARSGVDPFQPGDYDRLADGWAFQTFAADTDSIATTVYRRDE